MSIIDDFTQRSKCICEEPPRRTKGGWKLRCPVHNPPFGMVGYWDEPHGSPPGG